MKPMLNHWTAIILLLLLASLVMAFLSSVVTPRAMLPKMSSSMLTPPARAKSGAAGPTIALPAFSALHERVAILSSARDIQDFAATFNKMDESLRIMPANRMQISGDILHLPRQMSYADILLLLATLQRARPEQTSAARIAALPPTYRQNSRRIATAALGFSDESVRSMLQRASLDYFLAALLLEDAPAETSVEAAHRRFLAQAETMPLRPMPVPQRGIEPILAALTEQPIGRHVPFKLAPSELASFNASLAQKPRTTLKSLLAQIESFLHQTYPQRTDLFAALRRETLITYKLIEERDYKASSEEKPPLAEELVAAVNAHLNAIIAAAGRSLDQRIESTRHALVQRLQQDLLRDLEMALYYWMMDDVLLKQVMRASVAQAFENAQLNLVANDYLNSVFDSVPKAQRKNYFELKGQLINSEGLPFALIDELAELQPSEVAADIRAFARFLATPEFARLRALLASGAFDAAAAQLAALSGQERKYVVFAVVSISGYYVNLETKGSSILEGNYRAENFEISHLKRPAALYNCMNISAIYHYVLEELFGLETVGLNYVKHDSSFTGHQTNGILFEDGTILVADATNDEYYFITDSEFHLASTFDLDRYANTYIAGAYFNIHGHTARRYFDNPLYAAYAEWTDQRYFTYLLKLQQAARNNRYLLASRARMYQLMR